MNDIIFEIDDDTTFKQEENRKHNRKVALECSWIHRLFDESGLDVKEKQEVFNSVCYDIKKRREDKHG